MLDIHPIVSPASQSSLLNGREKPREGNASNDICSRGFMKRSLAEAARALKAYMAQGKWQVGFLLWDTLTLVCICKFLY